MPTKPIRLKGDHALPRVEWTHTVNVKSGMISQMAVANAVGGMMDAMRLVATNFPQWHGPVVFDYYRTPGKMAAAGEKAVPGSFTWRLRWRGSTAAVMSLQRRDERFHRSIDE